MQQQISRRHQESGGSAANGHPSSLLDRLLLPMFSMGFSDGNAVKDQEHFVEFKTAGKGKIGFSMKEGCIKLCDEFCNNNPEEEEVYSSGIGSKMLKRTGENPNLSFKKRETKSCSRGHWKPSEDAKLKELVAVYGPQNWNVIAEKLQGRSGKSCRLRWYNQLDPKINKTAFTEEEEERLMEAHRVYGNKWAFICRLFPGRTDNSVKNHWHVMMGRKYREKSKSNIRTKWSLNSQTALRPTSMQETAYKNHCVVSNYDSFVHGKPYSTSQISFAAPISPSPENQYHESTDFVESTAAPKFIDFLGVGAIRI